jgi:drug/metabolite transporter (DMT)-like permease
MPAPVLIALSLIAFAANSILCRLALRHGAIDPTSFTAVRLAAGAVMLVAVAGFPRGGSALVVRRSWASAGWLFLYAIAFSLAYVSLSASTGALLLFGSVQVTMLLLAFRGGERLGVRQWLGLLIAVGGLGWLLAPGVAAPPLGGAALMVLAGMAWGFYSVLGRGSSDPVGQTRTNFILAAPMALVVLGLSTQVARWPGWHVSRAGVLLAIISGAITSGLGYVAWYRALRHVSGVGAAVVQLATPVLTAAAGVVLLGESMSVRLVVAGGLVLAGIWGAMKG